MDPTSQSQCRSLGDDLPREMMDMAVKNMDKATLKACTLLSRHWYISARAALFKRITILGVSSGSNSLRAFYAFLALDSSSSMASCIKELRVCGERFCTGKDHLLTVEEIDRVLDKLPRLHSLNLFRLHLACPPPSASVKAWRYPRDMQSLVFDTIYWILPQAKSSKPRLDRDALSAFTFIKWLNMFGVVKDLHLKDFAHCRYKENVVLNDDVATVTLSQALDIKALRSFTPHVAAREFLRKLHASHSLRELSIGTANSLDTLQIVGHDLATLTLHCRNQYYMPTNAGVSKDIFGLSYCSKLIDLCIHIDIAKGLVCANIPDDLINVLKHCPATVSRITILHRPNIDEEADYCNLVDMPWDTMDALISARHALAEFTFEFHALCYYLDFYGLERAKTITAKLPRLHAMNVLGVVYP